MTTEVDRLISLYAFAAWIARHSFSGVAGISIRGAPICDSASLTAFITAGRAAQVPASPAPLAPSGFFLVGTGVLVRSKVQKSSARGMQ
jgi:hypothetical protein